MTFLLSRVKDYRQFLLPRHFRARGSRGFPLFGAAFQQEKRRGVFRGAFLLYGSSYFFLKSG